MVDAGVKPSPEGGDSAAPAFGCVWMGGRVGFMPTTFQAALFSDI
jgi:hypothetical protein